MRVQVFCIWEETDGIKGTRYVCVEIRKFVSGIEHELTT